MNGDQIRAWFVLEGWVPYSGADHEGFLHRDKEMYVWTRSRTGETYVWQRATADWLEEHCRDYGGRYDHVLTDEELKRLYSAVEMEQLA